MKPAAWSSELAWSIGSPITDGTETGCGPFETLIHTVLPTVLFVCGGGSWARTVPAGFADGTGRRRGLSPSFVSAATASVELVPTRSGTSAFGRPVETQIVISLCFGIRLPAGVLCLKTRPTAVVRLAWWLTTGTKPSALIFSRASCSGMLRYSSTATGFVELSLLEIWL